MATPSKQRTVVRVTTLDNLTTRWEELAQLTGQDLRKNSLKLLFLCVLCDGSRYNGGNPRNALPLLCGSFYHDFA